MDLTQLMAGLQPSPEESAKKIDEIAPHSKVITELKAQLDRIEQLLKDMIGISEESQ